MGLETFYHKDKLEIWGGVECTIVRVKNQVHDQLELNGHEQRTGDLALMADLGIRTIRYPLLWEKFEKNPSLFFEIHDKRLAELERLGITPVAGLLHHGSGPFNTDLLDPEFPEKLAAYASVIAGRYPSIRYYTPVNEPLTTARFSGLYGIWYPHKRDDHSFATMFLNEMKGIILSIREIRKINPRAALIQTEDLCRVHSTQDLWYQADFENERRWLTYDILHGRFRPGHPMYEYFKGSGISEATLAFFDQQDVRPEINGFNYYVTSERFLDHQYSRYPSKKQGGNSRQKYADVECVRVEKEPAGFYALLKEAWERYRHPLMLTEVHLCCSREEQLRWFYEAWSTGLRLKSEGVDFRAVTAWSMLGAYGWSTLLRRHLHRYESGVFDLSSGEPRPTALAHLIKKINQQEEISDPLLRIPGWWNRDIRIIYSSGTKSDRKVSRFLQSETDYKNIQPLLIIGANGELGKAFMRTCELRGIVYVPSGRDHIDITSGDTIQRQIREIRPWAVINAAGYSRIDEAENDPIRCFRENTMGAVVLAKTCAKEGIRMVTFSTDQVFNGRKRNPYIEKDITAPLNTFGLSKRMAEERILSVSPQALIIRSSSFFNPWNKDDILVRLLQSKTDEKAIISQFFPSDIISSPAYVPELVNLTLDLLIDGESGIWHLSSREGLSTYEFVKTAISLAGLDSSGIVPVSSGQIKFVAERPSYSLLMSSRGISLPPLEQLLHHFLAEYNKIRSAAA